jgi:PadR family transcriptional regulator, regulatory protein AphA
MELSKTAYVILGMLRMGRRTGYEIKALVDKSTRFFWAASYGQIYPELKRLEDAGLVEGEAAGTGDRRRREFQLTVAGAEALDAWLTAGPPLHFELRHEGVLRFFFSDSLSTDDRLGLLRSIRADHERLRDELQGIQPGAEEKAGDSAPLAVLQWGVAYQEFIIEWCSDTERRLAGQDASGKGS